MDYRGCGTSGARNGFGRCVRGVRVAARPSALRAWYCEGLFRSLLREPGTLYRRRPGLTRRNLKCRSPTNQASKIRKGPHGPFLFVSASYIGLIGCPTQLRTSPNFLDRLCRTGTDYVEVGDQSLGLSTFQLSLTVTTHPPYIFLKRPVPTALNAEGTSFSDLLTRLFEPPPATISGFNPARPFAS